MPAKKNKHGNQAPKSGKSPAKPPIKTTKAERILERRKGVEGCLANNKDAGDKAPRCRFGIYRSTARTEKCWLKSRSVLRAERVQLRHETAVQKSKEVQKKSKEVQKKSKEVQKKGKATPKKGTNAKKIGKIHGKATHTRFM